VICKICKSNIKFCRRLEKGLGFQLVVKCECDTEVHIPSSPMIGKTYEINRRFVFAMRLIGVGCQAIRNFCGLMDFGSTISKDIYYSVLEHISIAAHQVAQLVIRKAAREEREKNEAAGNLENHLSVSSDSSWAKRGFASLIGIVSLIGKYTGKILDVVVKSSVCKMCEKWAGKEHELEYDAWYEEHKEHCTANHTGSAGKMEVDGVLEMFSRSISLHNVYYKNYIGDGDTKTFKNLKDASPYGEDLEVNKMECVLHVKKRIYKRAKDAKKNLTQFKKSQRILQDNNENLQETPKRKASRTSSKKPMTPKVKTAAFTNKIMLELSTYYELAIRRNPNSIKEMRNDIWATFYHKISTDAKPQHSFCPPGAESWCKYRVAQASGKQEEYKHPPALDDDIQPALKSIYEDLTTDDLLWRCLGANTKNNNESFSACVWHLAPKHMFVGKKIIEIATNCALCTFNEGFKPLLKIMETMGVTIGMGAAAHAARKDKLRITEANRRDCEATKERRTQIRHEKAIENEYYEDTEGILYGPNIAD